MKITREGSRIVLNFPYDVPTMEKVKMIPGRKYHSDRKSWSFPLTSVKDFQRYFPSEIIPDTEIDEIITDPRLFKYQDYGINFLLDRKKCFLCDEMGMGKSSQAIMAAMNIKGRTLIICPSTLKKNWSNEIKKWTELPSNIIEGVKVKRLKSYSEPYRFTIVNYETLRSEDDLNEIRRQYFKAIVFDEAQRIKNFKTKLSQAVKQLESPYVFVLTGTPVENKPDDLFSISQVIDKSLFGTWQDFESRYIVKDQWGTVIRYLGLDELRQRIQPIMLRRMKTELGVELPEKLEQNVYVQLSIQERNIYKAIETQIKALPAGDGKTLALLTLLRLFCSHPKMIHDSEAFYAAKLSLPKSIPSKITETMQLLQELVPAHKVVVFTEYAQCVKMLYDSAKANRINARYIDGLIPTGGRQTIIDSFNKEPDIRVLFLSPVGEFGINLTSADYLINYDLPWNPARLQQRADRIHRIGSKHKTVNIINLVTENTIEEYVLEILKKKQGVFDKIVDGKTRDEPEVGMMSELLMRIRR